MSWRTRRSIKSVASRIAIVIAVATLAYFLAKSQRELWANTFGADYRESRGGAADVRQCRESAASEDVR